MRISDWSSDVCSSDLGLADQHYYQGIFRLQPGKALILETELPERVRYWNIQLNDPLWNRSEEHTSELQSLMRISYAVFCLKKKKTTTDSHYKTYTPV